MNSLITKYNVEALVVKKEEVEKLTAEHIRLLIEGYIPFTDSLIETGEYNIGKLETLFNDMYKTLMLTSEKIQTINAIVDSEEGLREHEEVKTILAIVTECDKVTYGTYKDLLDVITVLMNDKSTDEEAIKICLDLRHAVDCLVNMIKGA